MATNGYWRLFDWQVKILCLLHFSSCRVQYKGINFCPALITILTFWFGFNQYLSNCGGYITNQTLNCFDLTFVYFWYLKSFILKQIYSNFEIWNYLSIYPPVWFSFLEIFWLNSGVSARDVKISQIKKYSSFGYGSRRCRNIFKFSMLLIHSLLLLKTSSFLMRHYFQ